MKKLIALALCMLLLLSGCAYEGGAGGGMQLRDMLYAEGQEHIVDMRGLSAALEYGRSGDVSGVRLAVSKDDGSASQAVLALVDDAMLLTLDCAAGGSYAYVIEDPGMTDALEEGLAGLLPAEEDAAFGEMTDEELEAYMAELEKQLESMGLPDDSEGMTPEEERDMEAYMDRLERFQALLEGCITEGEPQQFEGESYATTNIDIGSDTMLELLDLLQVSDLVSDETSLGQMLADAGITAELSAVIAINDDGTRSAYGMSPVFTSDDGDSIRINFTVQDTHGDGSTDVYCDLSLNGETQAAFSITLAQYPLGDADWLPAAVPADAVVLDPEDEASLDSLVDGLSDFLGQVSGAVMGVTLGNRLVDALR